MSRRAATVAGPRIKVTRMGQRTTRKTLAGRQISVFIRHEVVGAVGRVGPGKHGHETVRRVAAPVEHPPGRSIVKRTLIGACRGNRTGRRRYEPGPIQYTCWGRGALDNST
jgi:threonine dehydrogenase-like Zn-dependent dehydrogenase